MAKRLFLDTSFAIALASATDKHHSRALALAETIERENIILITSQPIVFEIGNALSKAQSRQAGTALLEALMNDPNVEILALSGSLMHGVFQLFKNRPDKEWSLTDCASFLLMKEMDLAEALTADIHFTQSGFKALLLED